MKTISVILTKYSDLMSNFMYFLSGFGYTHASLALGESGDTMYSFNYKGFCVENIKAHRRRGVKKSVCITLQVSDETYNIMQDAVNNFLNNKKDFKYTKLGVILCFFKIPFKREKHYFCSQFVAELLSSNEEIKLKKKPNLYLPNHFLTELKSLSQFQSISYDIV